MRYGKIRNEKVRRYIDTAEDGGYTGQMFYEADGKSLKPATEVIKEQNLKSILITDGVDERFLQDYEFIEHDTFIEVLNELTDEGKTRASELKLRRIRNNRNRECFNIVNRGKVWYDTLTELQITELTEWYNDWLDAPQTGIEPIKPAWVN